MLNISYWAKNNPNKARFAIFVSHILLIMIGVSIGKYLDVIDYSLPKSFEFLAIFISMMGVFLYPFRFLYPKEEKHIYLTAKRKMDTALLIGGCLLSIFIGNHLAEYSTHFPFPTALASANLPHFVPKHSFKPLTNAPAPNLLLKIAEMKLITKILLLLGTIAIATLLIYFITIAGCSIACAGFTALSNIFMLGGLLFLLAGIILGTHHIFGHKPPSNKGKLFRKITGIAGLTSLLTMTISLFYYLTLSSSMSMGVPVFALLMFIAAAYYVVSQFDIKTPAKKE